MDQSRRDAIRSRLLAHRRGLSPAAAAQASTTLATTLREALHHRFSGTAGVLAAYHALPGEIDVTPALTALAEDGWRFALPVCRADGYMDFCPWSPGEELVTRRFGVQEPLSDPIALHTIDAVAVPGVAFDRLGNRLGHGVGFYDRFFDRCAQQSHVPYRLGISYEFQIVDLPAPEPWDIPMHLVVSPSEVIDTSSCE